MTGQICSKSTPKPGSNCFLDVYCMLPNALASYYEMWANIKLCCFVLKCIRIFKSIFSICLAAYATNSSVCIMLVVKWAGIGDWVYRCRVLAMLFRTGILPKLSCVLWMWTTGPCPIHDKATSWTRTEINKDQRINIMSVFRYQTYLT